MMTNDDAPGDFLADLIDHKKRVGGYMRLIADELFRRACDHDYSKLGPEEYDLFADSFAVFQQSVYGSEEYRAQLQRIGPAIEHHYRTNDHHPEFFTGGVNDMNLIQVVEMVCDWIASSERKTGSVSRSLAVNRDRFGIGGQLYGIIENTVKELTDRGTRDGEKPGPQ
jgi:hypothetical protein